MAPHPRKKRIEIDAPFAAVPQELLLDTHVSAAACRLWGVLFIFHWNDTPPDFDKLAAALVATERSVYRWLQELEARQWIGWHRNKGVPDRFTLHMRAGSESDTFVNSDDAKLTQVSKQLIPRSKRLTPVSEELTQVSISPLLDPLPMPQNDQVSSDQKIQKIHNTPPTPARPTLLGDGGGDDFYRELRRRGVGQTKARQIATLGGDMARTLALIDNRPNASDPNSLGRMINDIIDGVAGDVVRAPAASAAPLTATRPNLPDSIVSPADLARQIRERGR